MGNCVSWMVHIQNERTKVEHYGMKAVEHYFQVYNVPTTEGTEEESSIYRSIRTCDEDRQANYDRYYNGTLLSSLKEVCKQIPEKPAAGVRPVDHIEQVFITNKKGKKVPWKITHFKPTIKYTYGELWRMIGNTAAGFKKIGIKKDDVVSIYEDTRLEWFVTSYALWYIGAVGMTVYANLGDDALAYAIKEADVKWIVINGNLIANLVKVYRGKEGKKNLGTSTCGQGQFPFLIYLDTLSSKSHAIAVSEHMKFVSWQSLYDEGKAIVEAEGPPPMAKPKSDDVALIMYTSGTTENPKGVMLTYGNINASMQLVSERINMVPELDNKPGAEAIPDKAYVAVLPLAHILEFIAENIMYHRGYFVGYGTAKTLTDDSARPHGDFKEFKPYFFVGVPRIFDTIKKIVEAELPTGVRGAIFNQAYKDRVNALHNFQETPFYNNTVFKKTRDVFGGKMRAILCGGAPLAGKTQEFIIVSCCCIVVQGYGLTETTAAVSTQLPWEMRQGEVGSLLDGVEVKLRKTSEFMGSYGEGNFVGEIMVRGPSVALGYYKHEQRTKEVFGKDGFFATGDIGTFIRGNNMLKIVGRVKALSKIGNGEYIALEMLESLLVLNSIVLPNGAIIQVNPQKNYIGAIINTDEPKVMKFAKINKIEGSWPSILKQNGFNEAVADSLAETLLTNGRKKFECPRVVVCVSDEWSPENGILTAAQKLRRPEVDKRYAAAIEEMFGGTICST